MPHATPLIATIVMGIVFAFAGGFLASKLRLPPLVGYLLAGLAVGPFTPGFVADADLAGELAEIGVILLMFGVGLHFSVDDLLAVRRIAVPGAIGQIAVATALGAALALAWGWNFGAGLVFGLALSVASTVVLLRALEERNALDTSEGRIAVGWLIVEDLAMVLALVLLPALASPLGGNPAGLAGHAAGDSLALTIALTVGKVALFVALVLVVGKRVVPWLLEATQPRLACSRPPARTVPGCSSSPCPKVSRPGASSSSPARPTHGSTRRSAPTASASSRALSKRAWASRSWAGASSPSAS
jgi:CPA2 family monovalent cation:H+ antiporter-2